MTQAPQPGERRLDRPPSDRYIEADAEAPRTPPGSVTRAVIAGAAIAGIGVGLTFLLGGVLALSAGLLVLWAAVGHVIGLAVKAGGGTALGPPARPILAAGLALGGVAIGALVLWWYAGTEGGVLPLVDYLAQTFGVLVPLQAILAAGFAWWSAR